MDLRVVSKRKRCFSGGLHLMKPMPHGPAGCIVLPETLGYLTFAMRISEVCCDSIHPIRTGTCRFERITGSLLRKLKKWEPEAKYSMHCFVC